MPPKRPSLTASPFQRGSRRGTSAGKSPSPKRRSSAVQRSGDPFSHISIVHSFVDAMNAECTERRFLVCLRDQLPFVGIERGSDILTEFFRRYLLSETRIPDGYMLVRCALLHAKRLIRGRKKLKALWSKYVKSRREEIRFFVMQWTMREHQVQRHAKVSFVEYASAHVPAEFKMKIAAIIYSKYVHKYVKELRTIRERRRMQTDNFFLWISKSGVAMSSGAYYAARTFAIDSLPLAPYLPKFAFYTATIGEVVVEEAKRRFPKSAAQDDTMLFRLLVVNRTQKDSLVDPDMLLNGAFIKFTVVQQPPDVSWRMRHPFFNNPPDDSETRPQELLNVSQPSSGEVMQQQSAPTDNSLPLINKPLSISPSMEGGPPRVVSPPAHQTPKRTPSPQSSRVDPPSIGASLEQMAAPAKPSLSINSPPDEAPSVLSPQLASAKSTRSSLVGFGSNAEYPSRPFSGNSRFQMVAISKSVISMIGNKWMEHPAFEGQLTHVPVIHHHDDQIEYHMSEERKNAKEPNDWKGMIQSYERKWDEIRRSTARNNRAPLDTAPPKGWRPVSPKVEPVTKWPSRPQSSPRRKRKQNTVPSISLESQKRAEELGDAFAVAAASLTARCVRPSVSHSRFYSSKEKPYPALAQLGAFTIPTSKPATPKDVAIATLPAIGQ